MNLKWIFLLAYCVLFASCKREYASFQRSTYQGNYTKVKTEEFMEKEEISLKEMKVPEIAAGSGHEKQILKAGKSEVKEILKDLLPQKLLKKNRKEIKKENKTHKDRDPRYSRAMIMTIFGGLATLLGILAYGIAPTGLFIFVFGIIFLIGLVSLIMYLANPKPSM